MGVDFRKFHRQLVRERRRQVVDAIEGAPRNPRQILRQTDVAVDELDVLGDVLDQTQRPRRSQVVDHDDAMPLRDERPHQVRADEARSASDGYTHSGTAELDRGPKVFPHVMRTAHSRLPPLMAIATLIRMPSVVGRYALTLNRTPPLSVAYLAGSLTAAGHEAQVIDAVGEDIGALHPGYRD